MTLEEQIRTLVDRLGSDLKALSTDPQVRSAAACVSLQRLVQGLASIGVNRLILEDTLEALAKEASAYGGDKHHPMPTIWANP